jgi:flagellar motor switch protein FliN/FliY
MADETIQPDPGAGGPPAGDAVPAEPLAAAPAPEPGPNAGPDTPQGVSPGESPPVEAVAEVPPADLPADAAPPAAPSNAIGQEELDALASQASGSAEPAVIGATAVPVSVADAAPFAEPELTAAGPAAVTSIDLLNDVRLDVKIELGRTNMYIEDVLKLGPGSVVELDKLAGDPVDIYVSGRLIARGEVLVLNDNFCVRINDIHSPVPELETR